MTTYDVSIVSDANIVADKPIKQSQGRALRDNLIAVCEGDVTAPGIERKAIKAGGSAADGAWIDATSISGLGYFEPLSIVFAAARALPAVSILRVSGNVRISDIITLDGVNAVNALRIRQHLHGSVGNAGDDAASGVAMAGANFGDSGEVSAPAPYAAGIDVSTLRWPWLALRPLVGGKGGDITGGAAGGNGGGSLIMLVEGNVDCSSGTIRCNGATGAVSGGTSGAGAGGSIIIVATGTITNGTYEAKGGAGHSGAITFGGGGGYVALIASAFAGTRTKTVTGGAGSGGGTAGGNGFAEEVTLTAQQIRALLFRSY